MTARRLVTALVVSAITMVVVPANASRPAPRALSDPGSLAAPSTSGRPAFVPGEVLVRFADRLPTERARAAVAAAGARLSERIERFDVGVARLPAGVTVATGIARLERAPGVVSAEPNFLRYPAQEPPGAEPNDPMFQDQWSLDNDGQEHDVADTPGYPFPPLSYRQGTADADIDADLAWTVTHGAGDVVIAVVDSGVDVEHPELDGNLWANPGESGGGKETNGIDDDRNGYVDDVHGWNFPGDNHDLLAGSAYFGYDHGTHVAGIAAAEADNNQGISGVCPQCKVMVLKVFRPVDTGDRDSTPDTMAGSLSAELAALDYAADKGADIVNGSFGGPNWSRNERDAFATLGRRGVLAVLAAGNFNGDNDSYAEYNFHDGGSPTDSLGPFYPATYNLSKIVSVAAGDDDDRFGNSTECTAIEGLEPPCTFTNWGRDSVDVAAPGVDILSTVPGNAYATWDGTSMAAPVVSGVAGLVMAGRVDLSTNKETRATQVKNVLMNTVDKPDRLKSLDAFPNRTFSGSFIRTNGRVNAFDALTAVTATSDATVVNDGNINGAKRIDTLRRGAVAFPADENDVYKKRLRKGRRYLVSLDVPAGEDFALFAYEPKTKEIWQIEFSCFNGGPKCKLVGFVDDGGDESGTFKTATAGTYYFHVHAYKGQAGDYTLKLQRA